MKRNLDDKAFITPLKAGLVVIIILVAVLGFMVVSASDGGSSGGGSSDDYNPITKEYYIDTSVEMDAGGAIASPEFQNPTWSGESKRLNLEFASFDIFRTYNGQVVCTLYVGNEQVASSSESVKLEDSLTGWSITPGDADFSFGPIESEGPIDIRIVYQMSFSGIDVGDEVTIKGTIE